MDNKQFYQFLEKGNIPSSSDISSLKAIVEEYPYFQAGMFTYLKALFLHENEKFESELKHLSIFINNRQALFYYILSDEYSHFFEQTGKEYISEDKTHILLNAFFETRESPESDAELEYNLSHSSLASSDYFTYVNAVSSTIIQDETIQEEDAVPLKHQGIIDSFIEKSKEDGGIRILINNNDHSISNDIITDEHAREDELNEDMFFTETLAKIYIKQRKYEKAYKIIKHLSLNYPKKNIYFADQLSFLEKLIINSKFKDKK